MSELKSCRGVFYFVIARACRPAVSRGRPEPGLPLCYPHFTACLSSTEKSGGAVAEWPASCEKWSAGNKQLLECCALHACFSACTPTYYTVVVVMCSICATDTNSTTYSNSCIHWCAATCKLELNEERERERDPSSHPVNSVVQALLRSIC